MAVRKIAISIPEDVLTQVDRLAKKSKTTRSGLISRVLKEVSHASTQSEVTERINALFENADVAHEQRDISETFLKAAEKGLTEPEW